MKAPQTIAALIALFAWLSAPAANADFYVGGAVSRATVELEEGGIALDEDDTGWRAFAGYRAGLLLPVIDLAVEGGYRDFGEEEESVGPLRAQYDAKGWDLFALAIVEVGPVDLFGKVGRLWYDQTLRVTGLDDIDDDGDTDGYGLGVGLELGPLGVRAEWERFEPEGVDELEMISVGATLAF